MAAPTLDATNVVVLVGELSAPPRRRELPSGDILVEFDVTTRGDAGTCSVPVAWFEAGEAWTRLTVGTAVTVAGYIRRRFFRAGGATQSRTEVVAVGVVPAGRSKTAERLLAQVSAMLGRLPAP